MGLVLRPFNLIRSYRAQRRLPLSCPALPFQANIEPTSRCNFKCAMCQTSQWQRQRGDMSLEQFQRVLEQIPTLYSIKLVGMGEPFLNPHLFDMIELARSRGIAVKTTTNGSFLDQEHRRLVLASGLRYLNISLDGATAQTHNAIRPGADFDRIVADVTSLTAERGNRRRPRVRVWYVAQKQSFSELPTLVDLCGDMKVDSLVCHFSLTNFGRDDLREPTASQRVTDGEVGEMVDQAEQRAKKVRLRFTHGFPGNGVPVPPSAKRCKWPWRDLFINFQGFVTPCALVSDPEIVNFGNIFEEEFEGIWNGPRYQEFRRLVRSRQYPEFCDACS